MPKAFCGSQNKRLQFYCLPQVATASRLQYGEIIPGLLVCCVYYLRLCGGFLGVCGGREGRCRSSDFLASSEISEMSPMDGLNVLFYVSIFSLKICPCPSSTSFISYLIFSLIGWSIVLGETIVYKESATISWESWYELGILLMNLIVMASYLESPVYSIQREEAQSS